MKTHNRTIFRLTELLGLCALLASLTMLTACGGDGSSYIVVMLTSAEPIQLRELDVSVRNAGDVVMRSVIREASLPPDKTFGVKLGKERTGEVEVSVTAKRDGGEVLTASGRVTIAPGKTARLTLALGVDAPTDGGTNVDGGGDLGADMQSGNDMSGSDADMKSSGADMKSSGADMNGDVDMGADMNGNGVDMGCPSGKTSCEGICVDTSRDSQNCGACGHACVTPNGTPTCEQGACVLAMCNADWADCNGDAADGCETQLSSAPANCGACGHSCLGGDCLGGACQPVVLASGQNGPHGLDVDAASVYWTNDNGGTVMKVAK